MRDKHLPQDDVVYEAWEKLLDSYKQMADLHANMFAFESRKLKMTPIEEIVFYAMASRALWESDVEVCPQFQIGSYRVDFLVRIGTGNSLQHFVVECDGHDFHERTKEQAQKDKQRDRDLQGLGYKVYRFTGSEIWKSRGQCVIDALGIAPAPRD